MSIAMPAHQYLSNDTGYQELEEQNKGHKETEKSRQVRGYINKG